MHASLLAAVTDQPHLIGAALLLCAGVAGTRVLREIAAKGTVWWALGQVGGSLCAALLAGLIGIVNGLAAPAVVAVMIAAAWAGVEVGDRLAKGVLRWLPKVNGNMNGHV